MSQICNYIGLKPQIKCNINWINKEKLTIDQLSIFVALHDAMCL